MDLGGYMRVSRKGDRDPDKWLTVPAQKRAIQGWIDQREHRLADLREDIDVSGGLDDRPNLEDLITQVERGELAGIVVAKVDRFSRDLAYGAMVARRIERAGGLFVAAEDGVMIGPQGRDFGDNDSAHFLFAQLLSMADFFRRRTVRGWRQVRERQILDRGAHWGYAPPLGYVRGEDGVLEPHPEYAPMVTEAFERRAAGEGASSIARWLERRGVLSARNGKPTHRYVVDIIRNRAYLGEARAGELVNPTAHVALVDAGLFAAANQQTGKPRTRVYADREAPVLSGMVRCWGCRTVMTGSLDAFQGGKRRTYRCRRRHAHGDCPAPARAPEAEILDLIEPIFWEALDADAAAREIRDMDAEGARLDAELARAQRAMEVYRDAEDLADMEPAFFAKGLKTRLIAVREAQAAVDDWRRDRMREAVDVDGLRARWPGLSPAQRGALLGGVIGAVVVKRPAGSHRGHQVPLRGRAAVFLVDDLPDDLPRNGRRAVDRPYSFAPLDDEAVPWVLLGK